jgi:hypothetical protein
MDTVHCYSGSSYGERPRTFCHAGKTHAVSRIDRRWREPDSLHFHVTTAGGQRFHLSYQESSDRWNVSILQPHPSIYSATKEDIL